MKKVRRMLGDWRQEEIQAIMKLISSQSKTTVANWCIGYAEQNYLPKFERLRPSDERPRLAINAAKDWMSGSIKLPIAKKFILDCHECARENDADPIVLAFARAIGQGASVIHAVTHALGIAFYGGAAIAYSTAGVLAKVETLNAIASEEFTKIYNSLNKIAVKNEPNPSNPNWNC